MNKKYQVIYCDPPWKYEFPVSNSRKIENKYPTMTLNELMLIKIPSDENCILFMWTTAPKLKESIDLMYAWGFEYRTHAIWDKCALGMGYYFRISHELLMVGLKGKIPCPLPTQRISSVIKIKKREHSRKPDYIRTLIGEWYKDFNKIELFSRHKFEGWDSWGNEVPDHTQMLLTK